MFNWVCPRCGRENSPSYTECPDCKERDLKEAAAAEPPAPVYQQPAYQPPPAQEWQPPYQPPPAPVYAQPPQQYAQPQQYTPQQYPPPQPQYPPQQYAQPPQYAPQQYAPPQYPPQQPQYAQAPPVYPPQPQYAPPQPQYAAPPQPAPTPAPKPTPVTAAPAPVKPPVPSTPRTLPPVPPVEEGIGAKLSSLPAPVLMILFAGIFLLVIVGGYYGYQYFGKGGASTGAVHPAAAATKPKETNPIQKYIEVVGIRLTTDAKKKPIAKFLIVNHASTEVANLGGNVILWASTSRSEEDSVGSFAFHVDGIGPYESKEVSAPFVTKLKIYELPDWQNATAEVQITSPQP